MNGGISERKCFFMMVNPPDVTLISFFFSQVTLLRHLTMAEFSGCPLLVETLVRLNLRTRMLYNATRGWARGRDRSPRHHQELIEAILTYDHDQAVEAMRQHVRSGLQYELEAIGEDVHAAK